MVHYIAYPSLGSNMESNLYNGYYFTLNLHMKMCLMWLGLQATTQPLHKGLISGFIKFTRIHQVMNNNHVPYPQIVTHCLNCLSRKGGTTTVQ